MSLENASIQQLIDWQAAIVAELVRRTVVQQAPPQPAPPWEQVATHVPRAAPVVAQQAPQVLAPPAMLGGQHGVPQGLAPGTVIATAKTDPKMAALFAQQAVRHEGVAGPRGNGRGEGAIELSMIGG